MGRSFPGRGVGTSKGPKQARAQQEAKGSCLVRAERETTQGPTQGLAPIPSTQALPGLLALLRHPPRTSASPEGDIYFLSFVAVSQQPELQAAGTWQVLSLQLLLRDVKELFK